MAVLFAALAISTFFVPPRASAQTGTVEHSLRTGENAYVELKAADKAGANITSLAIRFNEALGLLENASRLEKSGDNATASTLASQAENSFSSIIPDAQSLKDAALSKRQQDANLQLYLVPISALTVAVAAVAILVIHRRISSRQFVELRVRAKVEG